MDKRGRANPLTNQARELLAAYSDEQILMSQTHSTDRDAEILETLAKVKRQLGGTSVALSAIVEILRERRNKD